MDGALHLPGAIADQEDGGGMSIDPLRYIDAQPAGFDKGNRIRLTNCRGSFRTDAGGGVHAFSTVILRVCAAAFSSFARVTVSTPSLNCALLDRKSVVRGKSG